MLNALVLSGLLIGLATGPHCVVMCGPACAGMGRACARSVTGATATTVTAATGSTTPTTSATSTTSTAAWHVGRLVGYSLAGAVVAGSVQSLGWLSQLAPWVKPAWVMLHAAMLAWGLAMLVRASPPAFGLAIARHIHKALQQQGARVPLLSFLVGVSWAVLPCGLLYSALMLSALGGSAAAGAGFMALFALGSGLALWISSVLWQRARGRMAAGWEPWTNRATGIALCIAAGWALVADARGTTVPWCG